MAKTTTKKRLLRPAPGPGELKSSAQRATSAIEIDRLATEAEKQLRKMICRVLHDAEAAVGRAIVPGLGRPTDTSDRALALVEFFSKVNELRDEAADVSLALERIRYQARLRVPEVANG